MAINPSTNPTMAGRITPPDANYPQGSSANESVAGARDGTPQFKDRSDDIFGLQQALLKSAGIIPTGNADTAILSQYMQAIIELASGRAVTYDDVGIADAYVLDVRTDQQAPASLFDGLIVVFAPLNTNGGASTVNVAGFGVKNIVDLGGNPLGADVLMVGQRVELAYALGADRFVHLNPTSSSLHPSLFQAGATGIIDPVNDIIITINAGDSSLFDISPGKVVFSDSYTDPSNPVEILVNFPGVTAQTVDDIATTSVTFLHLDIAGNVIQESTLRSGAFLRDHVAIGFVVHLDNVNINQATGLTETALANSLMTLTDFSSCMGAINCGVGDRNRVTGNSGTLGLDKGTGEWFFHAINARIDLKNPNIRTTIALVKPVLFIGWTVTDSVEGKIIGQDTIPAGVYDDGTAVLADALPQGIVGSNVWLNNRVFLAVSSNQLIVQIGQATYNSQAEAIAAMTTETFEILPAFLSTPPLATVTMRGGAIDLTLATDASIRQAIPPRATFQ